MPTRSSPLPQLSVEAMLDPTRWNRVLVEVQRQVGANAAALSVWRKHDPQMVEPVSATWATQATMEYVDHFGHQDIITPAVASSQVNETVLVQELVDMNEFRKTPFFKDWADKHDVALLAGIPFEVDEYSVGVLTLNRSSRDPVFTAEERGLIQNMIPFIQTGLMHRQRANQSQQAGGMLDFLSYGVVLLGEGGYIRYCSLPAETILGQDDGLRVKNKRLHATDPRFEDRLSGMIRNALEGYMGARGASLFLPRRGRLPPLHVLVVPLYRELAGLPVGGYVPTAVMIHELEATNESFVERQHVLQQAYGLTSLQADIAVKLAAGETLDQIANGERHRESVRTHLKSIYRKLPLSKNNHAELTRFVERLDLPLVYRHGRAPKPTDD